MFLIDPTLTDGAITTIRSYGILLSGGAIALFSARNAFASTARRGFLIFIALSGTFTAINNIHAILTGILNNNGWGTVIPTALLSIWGIALLLKEKVREA